MAYISNPVFLGVGTLDRADRESVLEKESWLRSNFKGAYASLTKLSVGEQQRLAAQLNALLARMPAEQRSQILAGANALKRIDTRAVTGLGVGEGAAVAAVQAADWSTKLANIAGVIASLTTVGFSVANFIQGRKDSKESKDLQDRQQKMAEDQMNAELAERQANLDAAKAQTAALTQQQQDAAKQKQIDAAGYMMNPDGSIVPKPKNTAATVGAVGAAAAVAFFLAK
jgi:hypothetical protein